MARDREQIGWGVTHEHDRIHGRIRRDGEKDGADLGLGAFSGGRLRPLCHVCFVVPADDYGPVEDVHRILDHILTGYLYRKLKAGHAR